jgi:hypothetical protein
MGVGWRYDDEWNADRWPAGGCRIVRWADIPAPPVNVTESKSGND